MKKMIKKILDFHRWKSMQYAKKRIKIDSRCYIFRWELETPEEYHARRKDAITFVLFNSIVFTLYKPIAKNHSREFVSN